MEHGCVEYLVRWEHWSAEDDTWEAADGLGDGPAMSEWWEAHGTGLRAGRGGVVQSARPRRPHKPGAFPFPRETLARSGREHASGASHGRGRHGCWELPTENRRMVYGEGSNWSGGRIYVVPEGAWGGAGMNFRAPGPVLKIGGVPHRAT